MGLPASTAWAGREDLPPDTPEMLFRALYTDWDLHELGPFRIAIPAGTPLLADRHMTGVSRKLAEHARSAPLRERSSLGEAQDAAIRALAYCWDGIAENITCMGGWQADVATEHLTACSALELNMAIRERYVRLVSGPEGAAPPPGSG